MLSVVAPSTLLDVIIMDVVVHLYLALWVTALQLIGSNLFVETLPKEPRLVKTNKLERWYGIFKYQQ
jgi:hypothetical protein